ncbi:MAG: cation:proton antiporter [Cyanobacteria bacterium P01_F01_bin.143]
MIGYLDLILRLVIWFLLTADFSTPNIIMGVAIAFLLPRNAFKSSSIKDWLQTFWDILMAIPQAFIEAVEIMIRPHDEEDIVIEKVKPRRTPGLIFLDIFLITFTPKTIVVKYQKKGSYKVHRVKRKLSNK